MVITWIRQFFFEQSCSEYRSASNCPRHNMCSTPPKVVKTIFSRWPVEAKKIEVISFVIQFYFNIILIVIVSYLCEFARIYIIELLNKTLMSYTDTLVVHFIWTYFPRLLVLTPATLFPGFTLGDTWSNFLLSLDTIKYAALNAALALR
jgi:hypothetical protein